jgi:hypothetical protein
MRTGFALDLAPVRCEVDLADGAEAEPVAGCAARRPLSASVVEGVADVLAELGSKPATSAPPTTAADVVRRSKARLRGAHRAARFAAGRVSAERPAPTNSPRSCARRSAA